MFNAANRRESRFCNLYFGNCFFVFHEIKVAVAIYGFAQEFLSSVSDLRFTLNDGINAMK